MKKFIFIACILFLATVSVFAQLDSPKNNQSSNDKTEFYNGKAVKAGTVLLKFKENTSENKKNNVFRGLTDIDIQHDEVIDVYFIHSQSHDTTFLMNYFESKSEIKIVEPDQLMRLDKIPNDPNVQKLWGFWNLGQIVNGREGVAGIDSKMTNAWNIATGSQVNVAAVLDTGIAHNHPDLNDNIWKAPTSYTININGQLITCDAGTHGIDLVNLDCDPTDENNHGTHVSGIIGAQGNNQMGVTGINWRANLLGIKIFEQESGSMGNAIRGVSYAIQIKRLFGDLANIRVLNNSYSFEDFSEMFLDAVRQANTENMLFVTAAGNGGSDYIGDDNDNYGIYPANFNLPNVISVTAINNRGDKPVFFNYGAHTVHLGAPGVDIYSTIDENDYGYLTGTSQAAPQVSGAALLILSKCNLDTSALKSSILDNTDPTASLAGKTITGGRLNVYRALRACTTEPTSNHYSVVPLPKPNGTNKVDVRDINNFGQITGTIFNPLPRKAFNYSLDSGITFLSQTEEGTEGRAINDLGWITGELGTNMPGFLYKPNNGIVQFSGLNAINGINNSGQIIGGSSNGPAYRNIDGSIISMNVTGTPEDINNTGEVAVYRATNPRQSYIYDTRNNNIIELPNENYNPRIWALNNFGQAAGRITVGAATSGNPDRCFIYDRAQGYAITPFVSETSNTICVDINDSGLAVGYTESLSAGGGFIFDKIGGIRFLNTLIASNSGYSITRTWGINNAGQIIADARFPDGSISGVLLNPSHPTPTGNNVQVQTGSVAVVYSNVTASGETFVGPLPLPPASILPANYTLTGSSLAYDVRTTATFTDSNRVCFNLSSITDETAFNRMKLLHYESGVYVDRTISRDFSTLEICASVTSFSPFVVALSPLAPTASTATVSGRAMSENGKGISNVLVTMTDANGYQRTVETGMSGRYSFSDVPVGQTYILTARAKRYHFPVSSQIVNINENNDDINFVGILRQFGLAFLSQSDTNFSTFQKSMFP